ncbi:hypothetical protein [Sphingobium sp. YR768]|nr:hypothetical protein [Sphingobium sp. YR768]SES08820.1 hypothetical protein SAMN05518866_13754 [Sphingobium sp. YR768]
MFRPADFETLRTCFASGQMSEAQLKQHFADNPMFRRWWDRRAKGR